LGNTDYEAGRWEAIVVDNASTDGSAEAARRVFTWVTCRHNPANWGFARGYNGAMAAAPGPYVALLNSDTRVRPGWLAALVRAAEADRRIGAATAKCVFPLDGPYGGRIQNAGGVLLPDGSGRDRGTLVQDGRVSYEADAGQYDQREEVFFFSGAAVLLRTEALTDAGLFDERYFMYYEDLDLSWRLRLRGWKITYVPDAVVEHEHAASSKEWSPFFTYNVERNRLLTLLKLGPAWLAAREVARYGAEFALNCGRVGRWAITRRQRGPHAARTRLQGRVLLGVVRHLPGVLAERRRIRRTSLVPPRDVERWLAGRGT
jgi:GT2 family glycosyltransferase